jgi:hypothetical protein
VVESGVEVADTRPVDVLARAGAGKAADEMRGADADALGTANGGGGARDGAANALAGREDKLEALVGAGSMEECEAGGAPLPCEVEACGSCKG